MQIELIQNGFKKLNVTIKKIADVSSAGNVTVIRFLRGKAKPHKGTVLMFARTLLQICESEEKEARERLAVIEAVKKDVKAELQKEGLF